MELAKIIGKVWATKKADGLDGQRFALAQFITSDGALSPRTLVACDTIGAGVGDTVLVAHGRAPRRAGPGRTCRLRGHRYRGLRRTAVNLENKGGARQ